MNCCLCVFPCIDGAALALFENNKEADCTKLIAKYLLIEIQQNDTQSSIICRDCLKQLDDFHKFFQFIQQRQKLLTDDLKTCNYMQACETEETLLDVKDLVPDIVSLSATIENPLSLPIECENPTDVNEIVEKIKKSESCANSDTLCSSEGSKQWKQNQTEEDKEFADEMIAKHFQLKCEHCGELMKTFKSLKIHFRKRHSKEGFVICCGRRFRLKNQLLDHIQIHLNPEYFKCDACNKILKCRERLQIHKRVKHSDRQELKHECTMCSKRFACVSTLNSHMLVHSKERNHICEICNKGFKSSAFLKAHMESHKGTKPYVCETCGQDYRNKPSFERHVALHEGRIMEPTDECLECGKWFTHDGLQRHMRSHKLEAVDCKVCGKTLKSKNALRGHMDYAHRRQQTFSCTFCQKTFKRPCVYKEHIAIHTNVKEYKCLHCWREFRSKANMYSHIKKLHIKEWAETQLMRFKGPKELAIKSNEDLNDQTVSS